MRRRLIYALDIAEEPCAGGLDLAFDVFDESASYALRFLRTAGALVTPKEGRATYKTVSQATSRHPIFEH